MLPHQLLYYITDRSQFPGDEPTRRRLLLKKISQAAEAGVDYIQLREKDLPSRELEALAGDAIRVMREAQLQAGSRKRRIALLLNSRTDIAAAVGADGVHLRSDDISPAEVRRILAHRGHKVRELIRIKMGPLALEKLASGEFRPLSPKEVRALKEYASGRESRKPGHEEGKAKQPPTREDRREKESE